MAAHFNRLTLFFACTSLILASALIWLLAPQFSQNKTEARYDEDIVFPAKVFLSTEAYVATTGTLTADWIAYKNNTFSILCALQECIVADVAQIGPKQVSSINGPVTYPITRWTKDEVVAQGDALCARTTITFDRGTKTVLWVETPINQTEIACKNADNTVRKATIETSLYLRRSK
jgi:hypothetical protein